MYAVKIFCNMSSVVRIILLVTLSQNLGVWTLVPYAAVLGTLCAFYYRVPWGARRAPRRRWTRAEVGGGGRRRPVGRSER